MISDPEATLVDPISSIVMRTLDVVKETILAIAEQRKRPPQREGG